MTQAVSYINSVWDYLVEQEIMDRTAAEELQQRGAADRVPLGRILVEEKFLTMAQLMQVLELTDKRPYMRIGDIAVEEDFCSREEVERAIAIQRKRSRHPIEHLLESPHYRRGPLFAALGEYISAMESRMRRLTAQLDEYQV